MPHPIKDENEIKLLHPEIKNVFLSRRKTAKFCFIIFEDENTYKLVMKNLQGVRINGKKLVAKKALATDLTIRKRKKKLKQAFTIDTKGDADEMNRSMDVKFNSVYIEQRSVASSAPPTEETVIYQKMQSTTKRKTITPKLRRYF